MKILYVAGFCLVTSFYLKAAESRLEYIQEENRKGVVELARVCSLGNGVFVQQDWGCMTRTAPENSNVGFNFIFIDKAVSEQNLIEILSQARPFYNETLYEIWMDSNNVQHQSFIEGQGYKYEGHYPSMYLHVAKPFDQGAPAGVSCLNVSSEDDLFQWVQITAKVYNLDEQRLFGLAKEMVKDHAVSLYLALCEGVPAATRMMLRYETTSTGYFSATLPDYRRKGIASALMKYSLHEAHAEKADLFVNQASPNGAIVWDKFGMHGDGNVFICFSNKNK